MYTKFVHGLKISGLLLVLLYWQKNKLLLTWKTSPIILRWVNFGVFLVLNCSI